MSLPTKRLGAICRGLLQKLDSCKNPWFSW